MKFQVDATISGKNVVAGDAKIHQIFANDVVGLDIGHVVLITVAGLQGRWDGVAPTEVDADSGAETAVPYRLAIITRKQFDGDSSVTAMVKGDFVRDNCVLSDDSGLTAAAEFYLSLSDLWAEGEW